MFKIVIKGHTFEWFNGFSVQLDYNAVASKFSFNALFEPSNLLHRELFKPFSYNPIKVYYKDKLLLTGTILNMKYSSKAEQSLVNIEGYSKAGVLQDCNVHKKDYPIEWIDATTLFVIEKLITPFGLTVTVKGEAKEILNEEEPKISIGESEKISSFIAKLCLDKGLVLSHDSYGNLVIEKTVTPKESVQLFSGQDPNISMGLSVNGQAMSSHIYMVKEQGMDFESLKNIDLQGVYDSFGYAEYDDYDKFVESYRPITLKASTGKEKDLKAANRKKRGALLKKALKLSVSSERIEFLNGELITPNTVISVKNDDLFMFKETNFFIESVTVKQSLAGDNCTFTCVKPESYNEDDIKIDFV